MRRGLHSAKYSMHLRNVEVIIQAVLDLYPNQIADSIAAPIQLDSSSEEDENTSIIKAIEAGFAKLTHGLFNGTGWPPPQPTVRSRSQDTMAESNA